MFGPKTKVETTTDPHQVKQAQTLETEQLPPPPPPHRTLRPHFKLGLCGGDTHTSLSVVYGFLGKETGASEDLVLPLTFQTGCWLWALQEQSPLTSVCVRECTGEVNGDVLMIGIPLYPLEHASTLKPFLTGWQQPEGCSIHGLCLQERRSTTAILRSSMCDLKYVIPHKHALAPPVLTAEEGALMAFAFLRHDYLPCTL